jgi:transposase-like protein
MWLVTNAKTGTSARALQQGLGFGSYQTAWAWLHKLRRAMVRPDRDRLKGPVEVDETYWGAGDDAMHGRRLAAQRTLIAIAVEQIGRHGLGRIRLSRVRDATADSLTAFVEAAVQPGSVITTDGWSGYARLTGRGYGHRVIPLERRRRPPTELLPRVHRVAALLKRWLLGTHQGAVSFDHLDYYLDEFTFRFNRRTSHYRGKLFYRLVQQAVSVAPAPYKKLIGGKPQHLGAT